MSDLYKEHNSDQENAGNEPEQTYRDSNPIQQPEDAAEEVVEIQAEEESASIQQPEESASEEKEQVTYSWVSPKLRKQQDSEDQENTASDPWGNNSSRVWTAETPTEKIPRSMPGSGSEDTRGRARRKKVKTASSKKKPAGTGKKWAMTVSMAVVFGLVSGLVFTGVTAAGKKLTQEESVAEKVEVASTEHALPETSVQDSTQEAFQAPATTTAGTVADVAAQCMPSLVTISTISVEEMQSFFGQTQQYEVEGAGTGVIVGQNDTELLIATNNHVISGAKSLSVGFIDETAVSGAVKGYDASTDLAVVAVNIEDISSETMGQIRICEMGDSDALVLGEQVVAIGNALGYGQSVTSGYVSAFNRELELSDGNYSFTSTGLIQTDASINSGNSGGALLNMKGQLIGINEAKSSGSSSSASVDNIGFAIPISKAEPILENLMTLTTRTRVSEDQAAYIGITCADVNEETAAMYNMPTGVCLTSIMEGSPAEQAGLKKGDILTSFDGRDVSSYSELIDILAYYSAGETIDVIVQRSDEGEYSERTVSLTLGSASDMPENYKSGSSSEESQSDESYQESQGSQGRGWSRP